MKVVSICQTGSEKIGIIRKKNNTAQNRIAQDSSARQCLFVAVETCGCSDRTIQWTEFRKLNYVSINGLLQIYP